MLTELLKLIQHGGLVSPVYLAQRLKTSPAMVEMMLEDLQRQKLIKAVDFTGGCASESCGSCALGGSCSTQPARMWSMEIPS